MLPIPTSPSPCRARSPNVFERCSPLGLQIPGCRPPADFRPSFSAPSSQERTPSFKGHKFHVISGDIWHPSTTPSRRRWKVSPPELYVGPVTLCTRTGSLTTMFRALPSLMCRSALNCSRAAAPHERYHRRREGARGVLTPLAQFRRRVPWGGPFSGRCAH